MDWAELAEVRWGPAIGDPTPGIDVDGPTRRVVLDDTDDPYAVDERLAIMAEPREDSSPREECGHRDPIRLGL